MSYGFEFFDSLGNLQLSSDTYGWAIVDTKVLEADDYSWSGSGEVVTPAFDLIFNVDKMFTEYFMQTFASLGHSNFWGYTYWHQIVAQPEFQSFIDLQSTTITDKGDYNEVKLNCIWTITDIDSIVDYTLSTLPIVLLGR